MSGERYLGNDDTMEVHDLDNETPGCKINGIVIAGQDVPFTSPFIAADDGYDNCEFCIGGEER